MTTTAVAYRHETQQETGVWVHLRAYPVRIWVSDEEVEQAVAKSPPTENRTLKQIATNIAIGKRCGSYRDWPRAYGEQE